MLQMGLSKMRTERCGQWWPQQGQAKGSPGVGGGWMERVYEKMGEEKTKHVKAALQGVLLQRSRETDSSCWENGARRGLLRMREMRTRSCKKEEEDELSLRSMNDFASICHMPSSLFYFIVQFVCFPSEKLSATTCSAISVPPPSFRLSQAFMCIFHGTYYSLLFEPISPVDAGSMRAGPCFTHHSSPSAQ